MAGRADHSAGQGARTRPELSLAVLRSPRITRRA
jgi:hypothetical protein